MVSVFPVKKNKFVKRKTRLTRDVASVFQTRYLIIFKSYQRNAVRERDRQRDYFQNCYIFVARRSGCRAVFCASHVELIVALVVVSVCGQSSEFRRRRVPRRVSNCARVRGLVGCLSSRFCIYSGPNCAKA